MAQATNFEQQVREMEQSLDRRLEASEAHRQAFWKRSYASASAYEASVAPYRQKLAEMIGGPSASITDAALTAAQLSVRKTLIAETPTHRSFRTWFQARNGLTVYGILLVPNGASGNPAVVCLHGMGSSPEQVAGLMDEQDYVRAFGKRLAARGYVVFAPLMTNTAKLRSRLDRKAILLGTRLQWMEQQKIFSVIDFLQTLPEVDAKRIGTYGISWGGRTVMYQGALDPRVAATVISGHFNDTVPKMVTASPHYTAFVDTVEDYAFFPNLAVQFSDADAASLICPRPVFIEEGRSDRVVWYPMAEKAFAELRAHYQKLDVADRAEMKLFDGEHVVYGDDAFVFLDRWLKQKHVLEATPENVVVGYYDASTPPAVRIHSGDSVTIHTLGVASPTALKNAGLAESEIEPALLAVAKAKPEGRGHFLTGPVYVEGAEPGDVLEVQIQSIGLAVDYSFNGMGSNGTLADEFPKGGRKIIRLDRQRMVAPFAPGVEVPLRPFFGSLGLAPAASAGRVSSTPPGVHAGNLDNRELIAGTRLFIPVQATGALFQVGDGHAAQGDGEVDQTGLETSLIGEFRFVLHKDMHLKWPRAETPTHYIAMGIDADLNKAVKLAVQEAVEFLMAERNLSRADAYMLASVAVDLHITELVDVNKGVHAMIPKKIFTPLVQK